MESWNIGIMGKSLPLVGTPGEVIALRGPFGVGARWLACVCPCQRFPQAVARPGA
jgi:hypothetical protein